MNASIPPFTNVHGPCIHEGTSKHEDLFERLIVHMSVWTTLDSADTGCLSKFRLNRSGLKIQALIPMLGMGAPNLLNWNKFLAIK